MSVMDIDIILQRIFSYSKERKKKIGVLKNKMHYFVKYLVESVECVNEKLHDIHLKM